MDSRVNLLERGDLCCSQTPVVVFGLALDRSRVKMTLAWIVEDAVGHSVEFVAGGEYCRGDCGNFRRRNETCRSLSDGLRVDHGERQQSSPVIGGRSSKNAIVVA